MTTDDRFARNLSAWLAEDGAHRVPDHLAEVLVHTAATRQRPWWSSPERWLPVDTTLRPRLIDTSRLARVVLVAAILATLLGALLLYAGSHQTKLPPPFGPARNGVLLTSVDGDIFAVDPTTLAKRLVVGGSPVDFGPTFSRDGTKFMFLRVPPTACGSDDCGLFLMVANADGSNVRQLTPGLPMLDWQDWSPDGSKIAIDAAAPAGKTGHVLKVVNVDGTGTRTYDLGRPIHEMSWLPPDGKEIVLRGEQLQAGDPPVAIWAVDVATGMLRRLSPLAAHSDNDYQSIAVSPDGTRIGYRDDGDPDGVQQHILDLRTGVDTILPGPKSQWAGVFSPDGTKMVFIRASGPDKFQLWVATLDGSRPAIPLGPVVGQGSDGPSVNNYTWTPDGTGILAGYETENEALLLPIDGSPPIVLAHGGLANAGQQRLAP